VSAERVRALVESLPRDRPAAGPLLELLGRSDDASPAAVLTAWLKESPQWRTRVAAARAAQRSVTSGSTDLRTTLEGALEDPSIHVAVTAAGVLADVGMDSAQSSRWGAWIPMHLGRPSVAAALLPGLRDPERRELALAWARGELGPDVPRLLAFPTLALLGRADADALLLAALEEDRRTTYAAAAALTARLRGGEPASPLRHVLLPVVVRRAPVWGPYAPMSDMRGLLGLVEALAEGDAPGREEVLAAAARHRHPEMRKLARRLGATLPPAESPKRQDVDWARLRAAGAHPRLRFETEEGDFVVELDAEAAPLSVSALLGWADAGAYSGLTFHRVEPAFVLQSGDFDAPGGFGGPDRGLRSEFTRIPFRPGTVGIASAGKDTEGSQYFATHGLSPSLDGRYGAVGWIVRGKSVADAAAVGSSIHVVAPLVGGEEGGP